MKKHRGFISAILTVVLAVGMFFGGGVLSVFAADAIDEVAQPAASYYVPAKLSYMDKMSALPFEAPEDDNPDDTINYELRVTAPNGGAPHTFVASDTYVFDQVGIYNFAYVQVDTATDPDSVKVLYEKTAYCAVTGEFELRVKDGGADIPTYAPRGGAGFKLPEAKLYHKSEGMDDFEPLPDDEYTLTIAATQTENNVTSEAPVELGATMIYNNDGYQSIVYSAQLKGGTKSYTKSFEVQVQDALEDDEDPVLSAGGVPTTGSLNSKITLPKATATDLYDKNVKITIKVTKNDVNVPVANVDKKTGFARGAATGDAAGDVVFDNAYNTAFYPLETGRYIVTYTAQDDFGNVSPVPSRHTIMVEDRSAPTLTDIEEWMIPSTWGLNSNLKKDTADDAADDATLPFDGEENNMIRFPFPTYIDNSSTGDDDNGISRVSFEIKDTVNNTTVLRFYNIYDEENEANTQYAYNEGSKTTNGYYQQGEDPVTFDKVDGFLFDFKKYTENAKLSGDPSYFGAYTAQYQARDKDQNITTKTYTITLQDTYEDLIVPSIKVTNGLPDYVYLSEDLEYYTVPTAVVTDAGTDRTHIEYTLSVDATVETLTVKSGERLRILADGADLYLANADYDKDYGKAENADITFADQLEAQAELWIKVSGYTDPKLTFTVTATDAVGNSETFGGDKPVRLVLADDVKNAADLSLSIDTDGTYYQKANPAGGYAAGTQTVNIGGIGIEKIDSDQHHLYNSANNDKYDLGSFVIKGIPEAYRNFVGFELKLTDSKGRILDGISFDTYPVYDNDTQYGYKTENNAGKVMIVVDDIVVALSAGQYNLMIRAFDINGESVSKAFTIDIEGTGGDVTVDPMPSAIENIGTDAKVNVTYKLKNQASFSPYDDTDTMRRFMVRRISKVGNFSLMGSEFTAFSQGTASFEEGYYKFPENMTVNPAAKGAFKSVEPVYSVNVTDTADTVFEEQGVMPVYKAKGSVISLPAVVAHNTYANATVTVKAKYVKNGQTNDVLDSDISDKSANGFTFTAKEDAKYTVTYYASINNSSAGEHSVTIAVGDNLMPTFSAEKPEATQGNNIALDGRFKFSKLVILAGSNDTIGEDPGADDYSDNIKFTKILTHPNGTYELAAEYGNDARDRQLKEEDEDDDGFVLNAAGDYTVEYIAEDRAGNIARVVYTFTINGEKDAGPLPFRILATVLIILAVLLIAGVLLYFLRFQKKKIKG